MTKVRHHSKRVGTLSFVPFSHEPARARDLPLPGGKRHIAT